MALVGKKSFCSRFRFGPRTLLALVTVLCLSLGFVVHRAEKQRRAVQAIEAVGGTVWYEDDRNFGTLLRRWPVAKSNDRTDRFKRHFLHSVTEVDLRDTRSNDETLLQLASLTSIHHLTLDGTKITDDGVRSLRRLPELVFLSLSDTRITDAGLAYLKDAHQLGILLLSGTLVTDQGIEHIKGLPNLTLVGLRGSKVTQAGADALTSANPALANTSVW
jgi:hypothetical protein